MRIVTRPDFDGIVCAVIIMEAYGRELPVIWLEPSQIQNNSADIQTGDIMANLPFDKRCSVWFDHHVSNSMNRDVEGAFRIAPSAAGVAYQYYKEHGKMTRNFDRLIQETDIIDAAMLSMDQVLYPENYPFILLSMTVKNRDASDLDYWNRLVSLLRKKNIDEILKETDVKERCNKVINENKSYVDILKQYTKINGNISVTDFRDLERAPSGNRFLIYSLFPECVASVKIRYDDHDKNTVLVSIGRSIFNDGFNINIGMLLAKYGGGGHAGAGGCSMDASEAQKNIDEILEIMVSSILPPLTMSKVP
ncbi:MAG: exopolyphosphatase [Desulfamplus sp.]|nr:exopolyphosphatase [Desulfamplus sp.]